ncbi:MAG TPA: hypothetical protein VKA21_07425 [Candidatus Binatia bacterium]|nr:hypothetical protein [Candidatus Binatia bacterium]
MRSRDPRDAPLTRRADLLPDQLAHPPLGTRRAGEHPVRAGATGTGDDLLVLAWSAAELARERAAGTRVLRRLGVGPGMRIANTLPGALATPGSLLFGDVVEELGALDVPLGTVEDAAAARAAWELFDRVRPDVLVLADGRALFADPPAAPRPWWRGIVWLRTGPGPAQSELPVAAGFTGWQRLWLAVPEVTSFVGSSCAAGRLHVDERVVAEVADADPGTLVLTPLDRDGPSFRFATGIAARVVPACPCGEPGVALELR